jgi:hypothetical protein
MNKSLSWFGSPGEHVTCILCMHICMHAYAQLNNRLSFGQHWVWKQSAAKWSGAKPGNRALDVCCGSGDLAFMLSKLVGMNGQVRHILASTNRHRVLACMHACIRYNVVACTYTALCCISAYFLKQTSWYFLDANIPYTTCACAYACAWQVVGLDFAQDMLLDAEAREQRQRLPILRDYTTPMM